MKDYKPHEVAALNHLAEAWNAFVSEPQDHPSDNEEFCVAIHQCQHIIMARLAARVRPDLHPNHATGAE